MYQIPDHNWSALSIIEISYITPCDQTFRYCILSVELQSSLTYAVGWFLLAWLAKHSDGVCNGPAMIRKCTNINCIISTPKPRYPLPLPPSTAYMCQWAGSSLVQVMAWRQRRDNQCWWIVNCTLGNKLQWNRNQNARILIDKMRVKMSSVKRWPFCQDGY